MCRKTHRLAPCSTHGRALRKPITGCIAHPRTAAATANASSSSSRTKLLLRALAARAFAALGRLVDALEYGSGHDGSEGGGGGSHGVRIVSA